MSWGRRGRDDLAAARNDGPHAAPVVIPDGVVIGVDAACRTGKQSRPCRLPGQIKARLGYDTHSAAGRAASRASAHHGRDDVGQDSWRSSLRGGRALRRCHRGRLGRRCCRSSYVPNHDVSVRWGGVGVRGWVGGVGGVGGWGGRGTCVITNYTVPAISYVKTADAVAAHTQWGEKQCCSCGTPVA